MPGFFWKQIFEGKGKELKPILKTDWIKGCPLKLVVLVINFQSEFPKIHSTKLGRKISNEIGVEGCQFLSKLLEINKSITSLNLHGTFYFIYFR